VPPPSTFADGGGDPSAGGSGGSGSGSAASTPLGSGEGKEEAKLKSKYMRRSLKNVRLALPRLYLLRESALEIFWTNLKNSFFTFAPSPKNKLEGSKEKKTGAKVRNSVYKTLCRLTNLPYELSPSRRLQKSGLTKKWQRWEISNFDYLMHLNTIGESHLSWQFCCFFR
jgi:hypothetical protein